MKTELKVRRQELLQELNRINRQIRDVQKEMNQIERRIANRQPNTKAA
jgi:prefoldin subunit 5